MKRILSLLLTVSVLLSVLTLPIGATGAEKTLTVNGISYPVNESAVTAGGKTYDTVVIDKTTYLVIRTSTQFKAMTGSYNYVLAENVDLGGLTVSGNASSLISGWYGILEGNGKTVGGYSVSGNDAGLFGFHDNTKEVVIQNLTFGSSSAPITGSATGNGSNGVLCGKAHIKTLTLINCTSYVSFSSVKAAHSAFVGQANSSGATFVFRSCKAYGSIKSGNKGAAFLANVHYANVTVAFYDCINNVDVYGLSSEFGTGGFVGYVKSPDTTTLSFENCTNNGEVNGDNLEYPIGGFVGVYTPTEASGSCTFQNCYQLGSLPETGTYVGKYIGKNGSIDNVTVSHTDPAFSYNGLFGTYPYGTKTSRGSLHFSNTVNGLQTLPAAKAAYFQLADGSRQDCVNVRVLLALPEADVVNAKNAELKIVFQNLSGTPTEKTLTITDAQKPMDCYYAVFADTKIAEAANGYVMLAAVIKNVDATWTPSGENLAVYFTADGKLLYNNDPETLNGDPYRGMIVYPNGNEAALEAATSAADILCNGGYKTGVIADTEVGALDADVFKIYLGNTNSPLSQQASVAVGYIRYLRGDHAIAIKAGNDADLAQAIHQLITDCFSKGELIMNDAYLDKTIAAGAKIPEGWQLSLPAYTHGTLDQTLYSGGYGKHPGLATEKSTMQVINNTSATEFLNYLRMLELNGYTKTFENAIDGNRYASVKDAQGNVFYLYYMETTKENTADPFFDNRVHIICDLSSNVSLEEFCYSVPASKDTEFYVFNLNTTGEDTILIHTADNAWIMIDGGVTDWGTKVNDPDGKFADSIYQFMREKSGLKDGEKLVISAWYLTHAHRDHFLAFGSMLARNHAGIELQRILANVPDTSVISDDNHSYYVTVMDTVNTYYPNVKFLKAHAGMEIQLADVHFTVLSASDSLVQYWTSNQDEWNTHWSKWVYGKTCTQCDGSECLLGRKCYDFNNSSTVTKITIGNMTILSTGDAYRIDRWMVPYYSMDTLSVDILKVAHHFNNHELVGKDSAASQIDKSKFYWKLLEARANDTLYAIVTNIGFSASNSKTSWKNAFNNSQDHHFIEANYNTIYGFKSVNGEVVMTEYQAIYSYTGKVDNTAK